MRRAAIHRNERGSQLVEFAMVLIPLLVISAFALNVGWLIFARATLQYAVFAGARFAITGQVLNGYAGQDASIKAVVQQNSLFFLSGDTGLNAITVNYYSPQNLTAPIPAPGGNLGGNVVSVSVNNFPVKLLVPGLSTGVANGNLSASSTDVLEASPNGVAPLR